MCIHYPFTLARWQKCAVYTVATVFCHHSLTRMHRAWMNIFYLLYCIHVSGHVFLFSEVKSQSSVFENFPLLSFIFMTNNVKSGAWNRFEITIPVPILVPLK